MPNVKPETEAVAKKKPRLSLMTLAAMKEKSPNVTMLVDKMMAEGQPMVIAGPP